MSTLEYNIDALVGPTHNYAGLSWGNLASTTSRHALSNPRAAALEGLAKMKHLADLGVPQCVLPPQLRPDLHLLRRLGYTGDDAHILRTADPVLLAAAASSSSMWAANAATVSPSADSADQRLHLTPANLLTTLHRSIEAEPTTRFFRHLFPDPHLFAVHDPLPSSAFLSDEGAANHTRLCADHGQVALELFVFGRSAANPDLATPARFPARQTLEASQAIARRHQLDPDRTFFIQQHPAAIDAGVFHNDVAAVGHRNVLLLHENAWVDQPALLAQLQQRFAQLCHAPLHVLQVSAADLSLEESVSTYLFNSQIIDLPDGSMRLIAPLDCRDHPRARAAIEQILQSNSPITSVDFVSVNQSMRNGGGPACLRLRIPLTPEQRRASRINDITLTPALQQRLADWITRHYRESLSPQDLRDPHLLEESRAALQDLTQILNLPLDDHE